MRSSCCAAPPPEDFKTSRSVFEWLIAIIAWPKQKQKRCVSRRNKNYFSRLYKLFILFKTEITEKSTIETVQESSALLLYWFLFLRRSEASLSVTERVRSRRTQLSWISMNLVSMERILISCDSRAKKKHYSSHGGQKTAKKVGKNSVKNSFYNFCTAETAKAAGRTGPPTNSCKTHANPCHSASKFGR